MNPAGKPRHAADVRAQQFDNELLLLQLQKATGIWLNETASMVWLLCNGERTIVEIVELLRDTYPIAAASLPSDVEGALRLLSVHGAIEME